MARAGYWGNQERGKGQLAWMQRLMTIANNIFKPLEREKERKEKERVNET